MRSNKNVKEKTETDTLVKRAMYVVETEIKKRENLFGRNRDLVSFLFGFLPNESHHLLYLLRYIRVIHFSSLFRPPD